MDGVLGVVNRVGHVVGPVHHLLLEAGPLARGTSAEPVEDPCIVGVAAELAQAGLAGPGVLARGIKRCPREVQPGARPGLVGDFCLEPREHAQGLGIALEAADAMSEPVELLLPVVAEGRVTEIVRKPGHLDDIGVAAKCIAELAGDLRDLEGVGEAGAGKVGNPGEHDLGLGRQTPQADRVQHPRPVARERAAHRFLDRLDDESLSVVAVVARWDPHPSDPSGDRAASSLPQPAMSPTASLMIRPSARITSDEYPS